jgi:hypothetical protein
MPRSGHARAARVIALACALASAGACGAPRTVGGEAEPPVRGPLPLRANGPVVQQFLAFRPRRARSVPRRDNELRVVSEYSSVFEVGSATNGSVELDGEVWRTSLSVRRGLSRSTDIELELSALYASSGFLDVFIESWHDVFGLPDGGRETREHFDYSMRVESAGQTAWELDEAELGLADLPVTLTQMLAEPRAGVPGLALQAAVELPTGSESGGYGNGALDWGVALVAELSHGDWTIGAGASWVDRAPSSGFERTGLEVEDPLQGWLSAEWRVARPTSLLVALRYEGAVSDSLGIEELGGDVLELDLGLVRDLPGGSRLSLGISEDLLSQSGVDLTAFLALTSLF